MSPLVDETVISGEPIVYKLPDPSLKPDVRLDVFDQQFHAHSAILRIYSAFFRTFLDSPDKTSPLASASFRYDYVSVVDDDGTWGLEVVRNSDETCDETSISHRGNDPEENYNGMIGSTKINIAMEPQASRSKKCQDFKRLQGARETRAFHKLLSSMYRKTYHVSSISDLNDIVRLADFYCALPAVKASIDGVLLNSLDLIEMIPENSVEFLATAYKLHHGFLFRESLVHVVAEWKEGSTILDGHPELAQVVRSAYNRLHSQIHKATFDILRATNEDVRLFEVFQKAKKTLKADVDSTAGTALFFRNIYNSYAWSPYYCSAGVMKARQALELLLSNKLELAGLVPNSVPIQAGVGIYESKFLCVSIANHELSWDTTAAEW